jgi:ABC-2 type transport system permease protein
VTATARPAATAAIRRVGLARRIYGFGSLYGKTVRDSRLAFLVAALLTAGLVLLAGSATGLAFKTLESRREAAALATSLPAIFQGLYGRPVGLETLGGLVEWRYAQSFFMLVPLWSVVALGSTLAGEARRGSLEFVLATPLSRRRVALEKLAGHVTMVALLVVVVALVTWLTGAAFGTLPGDAIPVEAAIAFGLKIGLAILAAGSISFALAPFLGRAAATGFGSAILVAAYVVNGYRTSIPALDAIAPLSWYSWMSNHIPLAGMYDWPSLVPVAAMTVVFLAMGVLAFERRDLGATLAIPTPRIPHALVGTRGPASRSFAERLPIAVSWGLGLGLYALVIASSGQALADAIKKSPAIDQMMRAFYPNIDYASPGGILQLAFLSFSLLMFGFAAATIVSGWASDETSGRLETIMATPVGRARWIILGGLGAGLAIIAMVVVIAAGIGIGAASVGGDGLTPALGMAAPALYTLALLGVGIAVAGVVRPGLAAPVVGGLTLAFFLIDLFAPAFKLPDWVRQLSLNAHLGMPLIGQWDAPGIAVCLVLAVGGVGVGALGFARRDANP